MHHIANNGCKMQISNLLKVLNKITKNSNVCKDKLCAVAARLAAVDYRKLWWWWGGGGGNSPLFA